MHLGVSGLPFSGQGISSFSTPQIYAQPLQQIAQSFACNLMSAAVDQCHVASIRAMNHTRP